MKRKELVDEILSQEKELKLFPFVSNIISSIDSEHWERLLKSKYELLYDGEKKFLDSLDLLYKQSPLLALKVVTYIIDTYQRGSRKNAVSEPAIERINGWLLSSDSALKDRIDWGIKAWKTLSSGRSFITDSLMTLLVEGSETAPDLVYEKLNEIHERIVSIKYFLTFGESTEAFLKIARNIQSRIPRILPDALDRCLWNNRTASKDYSLDDSEIRAISEELYNCIFDENVVPKEEREHFLKQIIICSPVDTSCYAKSINELWRIEKSKTKYDDRTVNNCFFVYLNSHCLLYTSDAADE